MFPVFIFFRSAGGSPACCVERETRGRAARAPRIHANRILAGSLLVFSAFAAAAQTAIELPKLAPPLPELPPTFWEQHGCVIVGMIVLLAISAIGLWFHVIEKSFEVVPPEIQARKELQALQTLPEDGIVLSKVSQALRRYFISAFALTPGEYTTSEFCRVISGENEIGAELSAFVVNFLSACDEQKFSTSPQSASRTASGRALELIELAEVRRARLKQQATVPAAPESSRNP